MTDAEAQNRVRDLVHSARRLDLDYDDPSERYVALCKVIADARALDDTVGPGAKPGRVFILPTTPKQHAYYFILEVAKRSVKVAWFPAINTNSSKVVRGITIPRRYVDQAIRSADFLKAHFNKSVLDAEQTNQKK